MARLVTTAPQANVKELRLATVLYGGVSLCIYMHGVTKELHRLVRASNALENGKEAATTPVEEVYRDLLHELAEQSDGVRTRVVLDIVSGTSAGGINGIFLAKALAHDLELDPLRKLWLEEGDIRRLARGPVGWAARLPVWPGPPRSGRSGPLRRMVRAVFSVVAKVLRPIVMVLGAVLAWLMLPFFWLFDRVGLLRAPLKGDRVFTLAYDALQAMSAPNGRTPEAEVGAPRSLMPTGHRLRLFVTTTDIRGYFRTIRIWRPRAVTDRRHRHVLEFGYLPPGMDSFDDPALALAARATSCFPGAFPPVAIGSVGETLQGKGASWVPDRTKALIDNYFGIYTASGTDALESWFFDGGVLDNRPFGLAIGAIARQPASTEVDRKLLYIEPDPAPLPARQSTSEPRFVYTVRQALVRIPRAEPILDDLERVQAQNERARRVQGAVRAAFPSIEAVVVEAVGDSFDTAADFHARAQKLLGPAYVGYLLLKLQSVVDHFATVTSRLLGLPVESNQAAFVQAVMREWSLARDLTEPHGPGAGKAPPSGDEPPEPLLTEDQIEFLSSFDLGYGWRRIRFVIDGVNAMYENVDSRQQRPLRKDLNEAKRRLYDLRRRLEWVLSGEAFRGSEVETKMLTLFPPWPSDLRREPRGFPENPTEYARERLEGLDDARASLRAFLERERVLGGFRDELRATVEDVTAGWADDARRKVLVRYLGFPFWDAILYPARAFSDLEELDQIEVMRLSPRNASCLDAVGKGAEKLTGAGLAHFGAFFSPSGRRADYLWGRLDGAEQLVALLLDERDALGGGDAAGREVARGWCRRVFEAILEEEETLGAPADLLDRIKDATASLPAH